jgi:hypothetical protein
MRMAMMSTMHEVPGVTLAVFSANG